MTDRPKADNRRILTDYSASMKRLLANGAYNGGPRPSEHSIGNTSFLSDNGGAIPPNVLTISNTRSGDAYTNFCKENGHPIHPARMPLDLARFFIRFLTEPGDFIFDPFAGSNTTGQVAEEEGRRWLSVEQSILGSVGRFPTGSTLFTPNIS